MSRDIHIHVHVHLASESLILDAIQSLKEITMASKDETLAQLSDIQAQMDATAAQNDKANAEISAAITVNSANVAALTQQVADLQAIIAAGTGDVPQEITDKVGELATSAAAAKASSQRLDDINPDPTA